MNKLTEKIKISELDIDATLEELYPRTHVEWRRVAEYAYAKKTGAVFPPILVGIFNHKKYVPDGVHRVKMNQRLKLETIEANVKEYASFAEMYEDALVLNSKHGLPLKGNERRIALRKMLEEYKIPKRRASEILGVPIKKFTVFLERTYVNKDGKIECFKTSVWKSMRQQAFDEKEIQQVADNINQDIVTSTRIESLLKELKQAIENNLIPFNIPEVKELVSEIYFKLQEALKLD